MGVVNILEGWSQRTSESSEGERRADREFTVLFDSIEYTAEDAELATSSTLSIPRRNDPHPKDYYRRVIAVQARPVAPTLFAVSVQYSAREGGAAGPGEGDEVRGPLQQLPEVRCDYQYVTEDIDVDRMGQPLCNVLGEPFEGITRERALRVISISRNVTTFDPDTADQWEGATNEDTFLGHPPYTVKCSGISADKRWDAETPYWRVGARFTFNMAADANGVYGWKLRVVNEGFYKRAMDAAGAPIWNDEIDWWKTVLMRDHEGQPLRSPRLLNVNGDPLGHGADPVFLYFELLPTKPFDNLHLLD